MEKIFFHIDVNSAFLSWSAIHLLENGATIDLRTVPSIIGGNSEQRHGVVLAKSIKAKSYGIISGEPVVNALRKCPTLMIEPPNYQIYENYSQAFISFLSNLCPDIEQVSIDECFMDFTPISHKFSSPIEAALEIQNSIYNTFHFTVNIGISNRKVLAKMASDFEKPNKVHTLYDYEIKQKMWPLPVSSLFMCGKSSQEVLKNLEIHTIGDLAKANPDILFSHLKSHGKLLWEYANGIDSSSVLSEQQTLKGIGNSFTVEKDILTKEAAYKVLLSLSESVGQRLRACNKKAFLISTEIKYSTFKSVSHQTTLSFPIHSTDKIYEEACVLFDELWNLSPIRLLGIRTSKLVSCDEPVQMDLFSMQKNVQEKTEKQKQLDNALDQIRSRYGKDSVIRGSFLEKE